MLTHSKPPKIEQFILVFSIIAILLFVLPSQLKPWQYPSDDSFFYLQVAYNINEGYGSTFNTITTTNGYHPLWMVLCIILGKISGNDKILLLQFVFIFQVLLFILIAYLFRKTCRTLDIRNYYISLPLLATYFLAIGNYASEAHINGVMHFLLAYYFVRFKVLNINNAILLGVIITFLFFARLDNIFLIISVLISYSFGIKFKWENFKNIIIAGTLSLILVTPYLYFNYTKWGYFVPISGAIKSIFPDIVFDLNSLGSFGMIITFASILCFFFAFFVKIERDIRRVLFVFSLSTIISSIYIVCLTDHHTNWAWYYVSGVMTIAFFVPISLRYLADKLRISQKMQFFYITITTLLMLSGISRSWSEYFNPETRGFNPVQFRSINNCRWSINVGKWLDENLQPGSRILIYEWPGMIAYFSNMKLVPIDGLMNDFQFQDELLKLGIEAYVKDKSIEYFIAPYELFSQVLMGYENYYRNDGKLEFKIYSSLHRKEVGMICVDDLELIVKFDEVINCDGIPKIALWKFNN